MFYRADTKSMSVEQTKTDRRKEGRKRHREKGTQAEKERQLSGRQMNSLQRQTQTHRLTQRDSENEGRKGQSEEGWGQKGRVRDRKKDRQECRQSKAEKLTRQR